MKLGDKLNPRKRKLDNQPTEQNKSIKVIKPYEKKTHAKSDFQHGDRIEKQEDNGQENDKKKTDSDKKRMESLKKKRQEFRQKQMIIKSGLVDVVSIFSNINYLTLFVLSGHIF